MNQSEEDITLVERYFDEALSERERMNFAARLAVDESFKSLVENEKILINSIRHHGLREDLEFLKNIEKGLDDPKVIPMRSSRSWYYVAAASLAAILMIGLFFRPHSSAQKLFAENFQPYPNVFEPTVRGTSEPTKRSEAFQAYEQGDYSKAVMLFNQLLQEKEEAGILLLNGNANLMLGNVEEAKKNFITLNADFDELDIQSKWFLSLCYLKSGDMEHAKPILEELGNTEISYARKAKELLKEVK
ncbi:MAG: hypothetical protein ABIS36_05720 [Chryseolinea sp.]